MFFTDEECRERWQNEAAKLDGSTIERAHYIHDEGGLWLCLEVRLPDGALVSAYVARDDEGNGPGALHLSGPGNGSSILPALHSLTGAHARR